MTDDYAESQYPWDELDDSASCEVKGIYMYAGTLPDLGDTSAWFVRRDGRVLASGICDDMSIAIANAEQAAENWTDPEMRVYG